jgi:hypothetical protein
MPATEKIYIKADGKVALAYGAPALLTDFEYYDCCCCLYSLWNVYVDYITSNCSQLQDAGNFCLSRVNLPVGCQPGGDFGGESWEAHALIGNFEDDQCTVPCLTEEDM